MALLCNKGYSVALLNIGRRPVTDFRLRRLKIVQPGEWFDPARDTALAAGSVRGGARQEFTAPFSSAAALYLAAQPPGDSQGGKKQR